MSIRRAGVALAALFVAGASASAQSVLFVKADSAAGGNGTSWTLAFRDLQDALDAAAAPGSPVHEIWVAAGTYRPDRGTADRAASFQMKDGLVLGGFAGNEASRKDRRPWNNPTTLSGDLGTAFSYHVVTAYGVGSSALLDGFHITAGRADGTGVHAEGGGIRGEQTTMRLGGLTIRGNAAQYGGGCYFWESSPLFFNCQITGNHAYADTGGLHFETSYTVSMAPLVTNCTFTGNDAVIRNLGPALTATTVLGSLTLRNSIFWDNSFTTPSYYPNPMFGRINAAYTICQEAGGWPPQPLPPPPNTLTGDPGLVNGRGPDGQYGTSDDDARVAAGSRCIDSGDNGSLPADAFDLDDDGDVSEPWPIDPEGHQRQYDDPATTNTGAGSGAIVDMGAFEGPALAIALNASSISVQEASGGDLQVSLTRSPGTAISISASALGDPDLVPAPTTLQFNDSNWQDPQMLTISAAEDADSFNGAATITLEGPGVVSASIVATEIDNDAPPGLVYVNAGASGANTGGSWQDAFTSLSSALVYAAASGGNVHEIWVAQGIYKPAGNSFSLQSGLAIYGGFVGTESNRAERDYVLHPTILSGDVLDDDGPNFTNYSDNKDNVVVGSATNATAILDGFVVKGGKGGNEGGGGLYIYLGRPTIANTTFTLNLGAGARVDYDGNGGPTFTGCRFITNKSNGHSGGLYATKILAQFGGRLTLQGCEFVGNIAGNSGAGAEIWGPDLVVTDCVFDGNQLLNFSSQGGGLFIYVLDAFGDPGTAVVSGCTFKNHALFDNSQHGGGMYANGKGTIAVSNCTVTDNTGGHGAGMFGGFSVNPNSLMVSVSNSTFARNQGSLGGGALSITSQMSATACTFTQNSSNGNSGVGQLSGTITDCVFLENSAQGSAGATSSAGAKYINCTFVGNTATTRPGQNAYGGAVECSGTEFRQCTFTGNRAIGASSRGGAISAEQGVSIVQCTFYDNQADDRGGAVYATQGTLPARIIGSRFGGNSSGNYGGAIASFGGLIADCQLTGNAATNSGGAIQFIPNLSQPVSLVNCSVVGNTAPSGGGVYSHQGTTNIRNSILWDNSGGGTGQSIQFALTPGATVTAQYSCIQGWTGLPGAVGVVSGDPLFFDARGADGVYGTTDDDVSLVAGSSAVDAASNTVVPPDYLDLDGDGNITEPTPTDLSGGPRFIDDLLTPDTGVGAAPIVDMGGFEFDRIETVIQPCYANCDHSTAPPILNVNDFQCFLNKYAAADSYANCDGSTIAPVLNVNDFQCFLNRFAAGCP